VRRVRVSEAQFAAAHDRSNVQARKLHGERLHKAGIRMSRAVVVRQLVIDRVLGLERECVKVRSCRALHTLQNPRAVVASQPHRPGPLLHIPIRHQGNWLEQTPPAKANIRDPRNPFALDEQQHVRSRHDAARTEADACGQPRDFEAKLLENRREQSVLLEAVTASALTYDFALQAGKIKPHRKAKLHVHVLEREGRDVCEMKLPQGFNGGRAATAMRDPGEVRVEVEFVCAWISHVGSSM